MRNWSVSPGNGRCWGRASPCWTGTRKRTCRAAAPRFGPISWRIWPGLEHEKATDPRIGDLLADVDNSDLVSDPLSDAAVNVREWRRQYARMTRLPQPLIEETVRIASLAQQEWAAAREEANFARFLPWLERVVALKRREADALGYETRTV